MAILPISLTDSSQTTLALQQLLGRAAIIGSRRSALPNQRPDPPISFSTVLAAFLATDDPASRWLQRTGEAKNFTWRAILDERKIPPEAIEEARTATAPEQYLIQVNETTDSIAKILDQARSLQAGMGSTPGGPLDVRHLLAAYLFAPGTLHEGELAGWGFHRAEWAREFLSMLPSLAPADAVADELSAWQDRYANTFGEKPELVPPPPVWRLPGYTPDAASGQAEDDYLNVRADVNALAAVIAARQTEPPLAVGIFGDWGSGKTFFMRSLRRRIDELSYAARSGADSSREQRQAEITFYKHIVQVEFNAWHYTEGNLWASLVEHLFTNLRLAQDPQYTPDGFHEAHLRAVLLEEITKNQTLVATETTKKQAIEAERDAADAQLVALTAERDDRQAKLADLSPGSLIRPQELAPLLMGVQQVLTAAGFGELALQLGPEGDVAQQFAALRQSVAEAQSTFRYGSSVLTPLLRAPNRNHRFVLLLVALTAGPLFGMVSWLVIYVLGQLLALEVVQTIFAQGSGLLAGAATLMGGLAAWLRNQAQWSNEMLARLEKENQQLEALQAQKLAEYGKQVARLQQEVAALDAERLATEQRRADAERRITVATQELEQLTPVNLLARFIQDRTDSTDYRRHLGLLALVHRDFRTLSERMAAVNAGLLQATDVTAEIELRRNTACINRIVLYIDDLDRCPPHRVVEVLQAIHLLLSLQLFVVVVGVDARWVSEALAQRYPHLLNAEHPVGESNGELNFGRNTTPHDYLEKIFQIPIWLKPLGVQSARAMLAGLTRGQIKADLDAAPTNVTGEAGNAQGEIAPDATAEGEARDMPELSPPASIPEIDLKPEALMLNEKEFGFMQELVPLLGRSPRAMKRYVNLYRLLKASLDEATDPLLLQEAKPVADYAAALFLLAIVTGLPAISRSFFRALYRGQEQVQEPGHDLAWVLSELGAVPGTDAQMDLRQLEGWLGSYAQGAWREAPLAPFGRRAQQVARFSFRVEQVQG